MGRLGMALCQAAIRRFLIHRTAPMPSYRSLPARQLAALIRYLARLGR